MKKENLLQIRVQDPCMQSWSAMQPQSNGRFCGACSQTVIDFSAYSDEQLLDFFSTHRTDRVCGRFRDTQLGNNTRTQSRSWSVWFRSALALLLPFLFNTKADAQNIDSIPKVDLPGPREVRTEPWKLIMGKPVLNRIEPVKPVKPKTSGAATNPVKRKEEPFIDD